MAKRAVSRPVRMVDGSTTIAGRHWRYSVSDNLDAPLWAVNIHGFFAGGGVYWRESTRLAAKLGFRVINPNLPGFSGSEPLSWADLDLPTFAEGIVGLLDHLGAPAAMVLGHSMGGAMALQVAAQFPERTLGVVYRDGVVPSSWKERKGIIAKAFQPFLPDLGMGLDILSGLVTDIPDLAFSKLTSLISTAAPDIRLNARSLTGTFPVGAMLLACDYTPVAEEVARRKLVPILPMWGRFDRIVPASTGHEFGELVGEPVHWVTGGHSWMVPRPATQLDVLRATEHGRIFLDRVRVRAASLRHARSAAP